MDQSKPLQNEVDLDALIADLRKRKSFYHGIHVPDSYPAIAVWSDWFDDRHQKFYTDIQYVHLSDFLDADTGIAERLIREKMEVDDG